MVYSPFTPQVKTCPNETPATPQHKAKNELLVKGGSTVAWKMTLVFS